MAHLRQGLVLFASITAGAAGAYVGYRVVGWLGVAVFGLLVALVAVQVDMDGAAPIGSSQNTGLFAASLASQATESRAERAARRAGDASRRRGLRLAKLLGLAIAVIGGLGFVLFQLPR